MIQLLILLLLIALAFVGYIFFFRSDEVDEEVFEEIRNPQILQILVPRENDKTPLAAEQMFASIHGILRNQIKSMDFVSFEICSTYDQGIRFYVVAPQHLIKFIEGQIYAQYPAAEISHVNDYTQRERVSHLTDGRLNQPFVTTQELELSKDYIFPVKTFNDFNVDPLAAITAAMSDLGEGEELWVQLLARPLANEWQAKSKEYITAVREGKDLGQNLFDKFLADMSKALSNLGKTADGSRPAKEVVRLAPGQDEELNMIQAKMLKPGFQFRIRLITKAVDQFQSEQLMRNVIASYKQFTTSHLNSFTLDAEAELGESMYNLYTRRFLPKDADDILNIEELASVFHLPNITVETPNIMWSRARKAEPPLDLPTLRTSDEDITVFAETNYRGQRLPFGLKRADRRRHMYLLGKTGVGKSSTFKNMFISDILRGDGACFIDPHGQDIEEILRYIPPHRVDDVVYFDPGDTEFPIGFNMLELKDKSLRDLVADGVVSVFKKEFGESWGPRLQYLLQNAVATCLEAEDTTILAILRILSDNNYRKFILKQIDDPILLNFWEDEYAKMAQNSRLITEALAPIQNKVGRFVSSSIIRSIVGQTESTIDLRSIMDDGKILLVNLAQGRIGEENASLLGGMLITRLQAAAMSRVDVPEEERRDFFLFVDEFQNFATDSFAKILSEARKFRLNLVLTNQYIEQIPLTVRHSIFGNVGSLSSFVVSQSDAQIIAHEMAPIFTADDLVSLEAHSMYVKLCIDGMTSQPFSAKSLNYKERLQKFDQAEIIRNASRAKYGRPKRQVSLDIERWGKQKYSSSGNKSKMDWDEIINDKFTESEKLSGNALSSSEAADITEAEQGSVGETVVLSEEKQPSSNVPSTPKAPNISSSQSESPEVPGRTTSNTDKDHNNDSSKTRAGSDDPRATDGGVDTVDPDGLVWFNREYDQNLVPKEILQIQETYHVTGKLNLIGQNHKNPIPSKVDAGKQDQASDTPKQPENPPRPSNPSSHEADENSKKKRAVKFPKRPRDKSLDNNTKTAAQSDDKPREKDSNKKDSHIDGAIKPKPLQEGLEVLEESASFDEPINLEDFASTELEDSGPNYIDFRNHKQVEQDNLRILDKPDRDLD